MGRACPSPLEDVDDTHESRVLCLWVTHDALQYDLESGGRESGGRVGAERVGALLHRMSTVVKQV